MKKIIIYFHGLNSSHNSDKVERLKSAFPDDYVHAFPINIDPDIAIPELENNINNVLIDHLNEEIILFFVGTSLGAWWANKFGNEYQCTAILINPSPNPRYSLPSYGISKDICEKYSDIAYYPEKDYYFFAKYDEVIEHSIDWSWPHINLYNSANVGHRFCGPEFNDVISLIKKLSKYNQI